MWQKKNASNVQKIKNELQENAEINLKRIKKQANRNNINSISSNNNSFINSSGSSNKSNNRTKWNICKGTKCSKCI